MTSPIDINPDHLKIVRLILRENLSHSVAVWVFGSRANWTTNDSSDLDLALEGDSALDHDTIVDLEIAFERSDLPYTVDIVDVYTVDSKFKQIIEEQRVSLLAKNSQVNIKKKWKLVTLGELVNVTRGRSYRSVQLQENTNTALVTLKSFKRGGGYRHDGLKPYTGPFNIEQIIGPGEMVIAQTDITQNGDVIGRPAIVPHQQKFCNLIASLDAAIVRVGDTDQLDLKFLYYRLLVHDYIHHVRSQASGTTVLHLPRDTLQSFRFLLPPLVEQQRIVYKLKMLDDKIELNKRMNLTLEKMARALFKSWFVDFDPVRAKMDGRWRPGESIPGLPAHYYNMFPGRLIDSELVKIPKGWKMTSLYHYALLNPESWSKTNTPVEIKYVDLTNTKSGVIKSVNYYSWRNAPSRAQRILRPGDTIIGVVRPGNKSYALIGDTDLTGSTGFAVLRPLHPKYRELIYLASTAPNNINRLSHSADGAAYPAISPKEVANTRVPLIDESVRVLHEFSNLTAPIIDRMLLNSIENNILLTNRDTLLPKLMSGDLQAPLRADRERR